MGTMGKYCCFCCPANDHTEKSLDDLCSSCGKTYRFPLVDFPDHIEQYKIVEALGRGFYAATYVAERGALNKKVVLKVSPKVFFEFFSDKDFENECRQHANVAQGTEHIVDINEMFNATVEYGDVEIPCKIAELDYIEGKLLADYLDPKEEKLTAPTAAQIAIDLFRIRDELRNKNVNHNDLHAQNIIIEELGHGVRRANAIDDSVRAVAIDLGSISDASRSDSEQPRLGDLHRIGEHLNKLVDNLLRDPDKISDLDNRLANELQLIVHSISPSPENQRTPDSADIVTQIEEAYYHITQHWRPWRETFSLRTFATSYNAQTMQAWHVPKLLVDPDDQWLNTICAPGPQVITGMRGCGKTMLLRALQFHARAAERENETSAAIVNRLKADSYVGLFVSAQRLLDQLGSKTVTVGDPFARLFVAYGLEAVRAVHHLRDIDKTLVSELAYRYIGGAIDECLNLGERISSATNAYEFESKLISLLIELSRGDKKYTLPIHPNIAFPRLGSALRRCTSIWQSAQVLFLLDDVSTRYLNHSAIEKLLSGLLFQDPECAFKLTSEVQTIELGLKSPGENHPARIDRDLAVFDLGAEVYQKIKRQGKGNGKDFVEQILQQRAQYYTGHPRLTPSALLGDVPLETIATEIGNSHSNSPKRKEVYRGITALARMCVGDIGDVISLYEHILKKAAGEHVPIAPSTQSDCFQHFCARRLYDLNRQEGFLKDIAKSFAEASYELLVRSCKDAPNGDDKRRIRQYSSLYVRITTGNIEKQTERLRKFIDAGVFVFAGGSSVPRTKTRDSNPIQQFKLTYRKIYGLGNYIGLAERDRFELSGSDLEEWLEYPSRGKEILLRNLGGDWKKEDMEVSVSGEDQSAIELSIEKQLGDDPQMKLFGGEEIRLPVYDDGNVSTSTLVLNPLTVQKKIDGKITDFEDVTLELPIDQIVVGLGFEERSLDSVKRITQFTNATGAVAVGYREQGRSEEILKILSNTIRKHTVLEYQRIIETGFPDLEGNVLVDITGLAKPVIFHAIRNELRRKRRVWICHTEAEKHYPLDSDLRQILIAEEERDIHALLEKTQEVLTGEEGPYVSDNLLPSDSDETRQRVLCAASSPKHERLLSLLDYRDYDQVEIIAPKSESSRSKIAQIAAEVAADNVANANVTHIDSDDLDRMLNFVVKQYRIWYINNGLNFELGLTGSKLQAVACSAASAAFKVSQCWYIRPKTFDPKRFTKGVGNTHIYEISLDSL